MTTDKLLTRFPGATLNGKPMSKGKLVGDYVTHKNKMQFIFNLQQVSVTKLGRYKTRLLNWMRDAEPRIIILLNKSVVVTKNRFIHTFLKMVFALHPPNSNPSTAASVDEADHIINQLNKHH
jgi:hypothetical protein